MDESSCMVDVARFFMEFCMDESCGKCIPCRAGTVQMHDILQRMTRGEATEDDLAMLEELPSCCARPACAGSGQTAPNPVVSTLQLFPAGIRSAYPRATLSRRALPHRPPGRRRCSHERQDTPNRRQDGHRRRQARSIFAVAWEQRHPHPAPLPHRRALATSARAGCAWWRSKARRNCKPPA